MAGNNLFGGLNSGDSSKYKKAGEQAAKRERAEQLDARIDKFFGEKARYRMGKRSVIFRRGRNKTQLRYIRPIFERFSP